MTPLLVDLETGTRAAGWSDEEFVDALLNYAERRLFDHRQMRLAAGDHRS
jgi:hypothetical protein